MAAEICPHHQCTWARECEECQICWFHCVHRCGQDIEDDDVNIVSCEEDVHCTLCNHCEIHCECSTITPEQPSEQDAHYGGESGHDVSYISWNECTRVVETTDEGLALEWVRGKKRSVSELLTSPYVSLLDFRRVVRQPRHLSRVRGMAAAVARGRLTLCAPGTAPCTGTVLLDAPLPYPAGASPPAGFASVQSEEIRRCWERRSLNKKVLSWTGVSLGRVLVPVGGFPGFSTAGARVVCSSEARGDFRISPGHARVPYGTLELLGVPGIAGVRVFAGRRDLTTYGRARGCISLHALEASQERGYLVLGVTPGTCLVIGVPRPTQDPQIVTDYLERLRIGYSVPKLPSHVAASAASKIARAGVGASTDGISVSKLAKRAGLSSREVLLCLRDYSACDLASDDSGCYARLSSERVPARRRIRLKPVRLSRLVGLLLAKTEGGIVEALSGRPVSVSSGHVSVTSGVEQPVPPTGDPLVNGRVGHVADAVVVELYRGAMLLGSVAVGDSYAIEEVGRLLGLHHNGTCRNAVVLITAHEGVSILRESGGTDYAGWYRERCLMLLKGLQEVAVVHGPTGTGSRVTLKEMLQVM